MNTRPRDGFTGWRVALWRAWSVVYFGLPRPLDRLADWSDRRVYGLLRRTQR